MKDDEIILTISHPFGDIDMPLDAWKQQGPGARRFVAPIAAHHKSGYDLPLRVIPLVYRNNVWSRLLIKLGFLDNPWENIPIINPHPQKSQPDNK